MRRRLLIVALLVPPLYLVALAAWLLSWGSRDRVIASDGAKYDAIIIFGARVNSSGEASPVLRARTKRGFELWKLGVAPCLVCTGGVGTYPPAEAQVQEKLLRGWGVPEKDILLDITSTSTEENARNAAALLPPGARVVAVSEPFHLWRCCRNCGKVGLVASPSPEWPEWNAMPRRLQAFYLGREAVLVTRDFIFGLL